MALLSCTLTLSHSSLRRHVHKYTTSIHLSPPPSPPPRWNLPNPPVLPFRRLVSFPSYIPRSSLLSATAPLLQDAGATATVLAGAYGLVRTFDTLTQRNLIQQSLSRKLVHILSGLLFAGCWPIFSTSAQARYFASVVPLVNCLRLIVHGFSLVTDEGLIKSVTREGNPQELLRGPLYYVLILILCALVFWRESPTGVISLAMMCGGDGVADIIGRRFGSLKLPYNQHKSWAGSLSMLTCGFLISIGMLSYYSALGYFQLDWTWTIQRVALVALVATVVESLPITEVVDDNITVPLVSMVVSMLSFGY
ncbi:PREDICTED: probable phytol kinase 1, chloroplastic [Populus euphratica]|uniref:phytol kinase n=1 Tax=Populus euphratica TaxID=75702 RepID=A0AAJ6U7M5_POPEU|nr:PREDICTED: probable phytol kinase 1, chloroplastic [Populus euphratica]